MEKESNEVLNFRRVYKEYFTVENQKITIKSTKDSSSNNLKSPDDPKPHLAVSMETVMSVIVLFK